jgi:hypothetical protein
MTSLFSLPYPSYHIWINYTWITDIWKFSHQVKITVEVENQWLPRIARQHDVALMDLAISLSFNEFQLRSINTYRLFLQVTTLSDIVSANGEFIIPCIVEGYRDESRGTDLLWPNIPRPPISFWRHWHQFLQHFVTGHRLTQPLGQWFDDPMNSWHRFLDSKNTLWHTNPSDGNWTEYATVPPINHPRTRQTTKVYTAFATSTAPSLPLLPATITTQLNGTVSASPSSYPLHKATPPCPPDLWRHSTTPPALEDTPPCFQHLISTPPTADQCQEIAMEIQEKTLAVCSNGACDSQLNIASFAVVFASSLSQQTITTSVGPVDGHPSLVTSFRAELSGIIACLYIIHRICHHYQLESGSCTLYCDNKGALSNAFRPIRPGITPYLRTDHDLVEIAQSLLTILTIAITPTWVKGHYKGKKRE